MSKTRKQKMIDLLQEEIDQLEDLLIDTPAEFTAEEYQQIIARIEFMREALKKLQEMEGM